jgi:thymidylate kinase
MLLEIDGIAHTGKTTLVQALKKAKWVKDIHEFEHSENTVKDHWRDLIPLAEDDWVHVTDRGHGSEWVYSNLFQRDNPYSSEEFWELDTALAKHGTYVIYLEQPQEILMERYAKTGREPEGDLNLLENLWEYFLLDTACRVLRVDHRFNLDEIVQSLFRYVMVGE